MYMYMSYVIMWAGPHHSRKCMFIDMHDIDSADESTLCFTVYGHKYTCSAIINTLCQHATQ